MGKLLTHLEKQLKSEFKLDAEDCIKIFNKLVELEGTVWSSQWQILTTVKFKGFPSDERNYKPSKIGYIFLKAIK